MRNDQHIRFKTTNKGKIIYVYNRGLQPLIKIVSSKLD